MNRLERFAADLDLNSPNEIRLLLALVIIELDVEAADRLTEYILDVEMLLDGGRLELRFQGMHSWAVFDDPDSLIEAMAT